MNITRDVNISNVEYHRFWDEIENEKKCIQNRTCRIAKINAIIQKNKSNLDMVLSEIEAEYGEVFSIYETMYYIAVDIAIKINEKSEERRAAYKYISIFHIHGRACQIALEILCLLRNGFADGAFARCRSLWELAIYSQFISENDEGIAQEYYKQAEDENPPRKAVWVKNAPCIML